jgi:hypothetical protein
MLATWDLGLLSTIEDYPVEKTVTQFQGVLHKKSNGLKIYKMTYCRAYCSFL